MNNRHSESPASPADNDGDVAAQQAESGAEEQATESTERCPVIYADRVYLGLTGPRRLRVVCFSTDERRALTINAA